MIGQKEVLERISDEISMGEFPRFSIVVGADGSGKKTLAKHVANMLECDMMFVETKIDSIRDMIKRAYSCQAPTLYVILDSPMSINAKNALLKVCEETPTNAYIMMLVNNPSIILDTLWSRANIICMRPYSQDELLAYAQIGKEEVQNCDIVVELCETPGDVDKLYEYGVEEFYNYVEKVVDNIASVSSANAFKIAEKIAFKPTDSDKYDMTLFLRAFKSICGKGMRNSVLDNDVEGMLWYSTGIKVATDTLNQLSIVGINKGALFDIFILDIRREWA